METEQDSCRRQIFKEAFLAVHNGNTDVLADLYPKLNNNLNISFFTFTLCLCKTELEMIGCKSSTERYSLEQITDIIERGMCDHSSPEDGEKQLVTMSLLHYACVFGQKEIVEWLIDHGANVCAETAPSNYTPLQMIACGQKDESTTYEIMSLLINHGADATQRDALFGGTLLHFNIDRAYPSVIDLLLKNHCDIDAVDNDDQTALYCAVYLQRTEIIKLLVRNKADVNKGPPRDPVPLIMAVRSGDYEIVNALISTPLCNLEIDKGDDASTSVCGRTTALHYATFLGHLDIVTLLQSHGADVNGRDNEGNTPLITALLLNYTELFHELIKFGADLNLYNNTGFSAIHRAAWDGKEEHVKILLQHGCRYDTRTDDGNTPLALACHGGHESIALRLMELNVNVNNADNDLDTPLHFASHKGLKETCKRLVELGADPNARNSTSITPLWKAVFASSRSVVKFLIELNVSMSVATCGIDPRYYLRVPYTEPRTPLYVAFDQCEDPYIAAMIIIAGVNLSEEKWLRSTDLEVFNKSPGSAPHVDLLRSYTESPVSLKRLCRDEIRRKLATRLADALPLLGLPASLRDYILIKHDLQLCEAGRLDLLTYKFD